MGKLLNSELVVWAERLSSGTQLVFTGAHGVKENSPWGSTNLSFSVGHDSEHVENRRQELATLLHMPSIQFMHQTHGDNVEFFHGIERLTSEEVHQTDALVFSGPKAAAAVMVADCVPVLLYDDTQGVYAVAHAGRAGVLKGIVGKTVVKMRAQKAAKIHVVLGPAICAQCYEISETMSRETVVKHPGSLSETSWGTPAFNLKGEIIRQLTDFSDLYVRNIDICTYEDHRFFSYRRNRHTGRFAGVIAVDRF